MELGVSLTSRNNKFLLLIMAEWRMSYTWGEQNRLLTIPPHVLIAQPVKLAWKVYLPGTYRLETSCSLQAEKPQGTLTITAAGQTLKHQVQPTGQTVVEPNQQMHIPDFRAQQAGVISIEKPGIYEIKMEASPGEKAPLAFQWLWIT